MAKSVNIEITLYKLQCYLLFGLIICLSDVAFAQNGGKHWTEPTNIREFNSKGDEFAPHFSNFQQILYFNSDRDGKSYFYIASLIDSINFSEVKLFKSDINIIGRNQSYISTTNNNEAYFSSYRQSDKQSYLNIYRSIFKKNNWTEAIPVDSISTDAFCSHVTVSPDGTIMLFASTRGTNSNDIDLWMSLRNDNGYWSSPIPLNELNSTGNEITPFLLSSDTLYFASDGYEGPGGYDLYVSTRSGNKWERPKPLFDFNSEFNESDFIVLPDGRAIFASDRPGGLGKLDLYIALPFKKNEDIINNNLTDISIGTQVSNIIAEKLTELSYFPAFHIFNNKSFVNKVNSQKYKIDSLIYEYPNLVAKYLVANSNEILLIDSSSYNNQIIDYFVSKGINKERIIFQKVNDKQDYVKCKLLSGKNLPVIEMTENVYTYKPPVVEISIGSRENIAKGIHTLSVITDKARHDVFINDTKLPMRDIISLDEYDSEVFDSDSLIIHYKINSDRAILADAKRILFISRQEVRETKLNNENNEYFEEYFFVFAGDSFSNNDYLSTDYIKLIKDNLSNIRRIEMTFFDDSMKSNANKLKNIIFSEKAQKNFIIKSELAQYKTNNLFSQELSDKIVRIRVFKLR